MDDKQTEVPENSSLSAIDNTKSNKSSFGGIFGEAVSKSLAGRNDSFYQNNTENNLMQGNILLKII